MSNDTGKSIVVVHDTSKMIPLKDWMKDRKKRLQPPNIKKLQELYPLAIYPILDKWRIAVGTTNTPGFCDIFIGNPDRHIWVEVREQCDAEILTGSDWSWPSASTASIALNALVTERWHYDHPGTIIPGGKITPGMIVYERSTTNYYILCTTNGIWSWNSLRNGNFLTEPFRASNCSQPSYAEAFPRLDPSCTVFVPSNELIQAYFASLHPI